MPLEALLASVGSATLMMVGIRTMSLLVACRRRTPAWLRRRLGLKEGV
ncbi:MAG TPA: hypothetical protein VMT03_21215 [Polyangia bacterium]|nr:hypothetical protein [Polyangia bacterium]